MNLHEAIFIELSTIDNVINIFLDSVNNPSLHFLMYELDQKMAGYNKCIVYIPDKRIATFYQLW